jgi:PAP2 superfamily.
MNPEVLSSQSNYFVTFIASFLLWVMFAGLVYLWIIDGTVKKEVVLHAILASVIAWVIVTILKSTFPMVRPFQIDGRPPLTITVPTGSTFPSSHSAVAFAIAMSVWLHKKKMGIVFILLAILVAFGRVASNVHWSIDVVVGGCVGVLTAYGLERLHLFGLLKKK